MDKDMLLLTYTRCNNNIIGMVKDSIISRILLHLETLRKFIPYEDLVKNIYHLTVNMYIIDLMVLFPNIREGIVLFWRNSKKREDHNNYKPFIFIYEINTTTKR
jgi:hypothetical protein